MPDMRFAPPSALRLVDRGGGLNQTSVRAYNERLVLSMLRQKEGLSRLDISQISGLSAQTVSVITGALEQDGLIASGALLRGKVGPPSRLLALDPDGAFAIGIKIGTRSTDIVLIDFVGAIRRRLEHRYVSPVLGDVLPFVERGIGELIAALSKRQRDRLVGIGIAVPEEIETWPLPHWPRSGQSWAGIDFEALVGDIVNLPVFIQNDITAAASAELVHGTARAMGDFAYFFIGATTASRLVLNHHVYAGRGQGPNVPGLNDLAEAVAVSGKNPEIIWSNVQKWSGIDAIVDDWVHRCGVDLMRGYSLMSSFVDIPAIVIDSRAPAPVRDGLASRITKVLSEWGDGRTGVDVTSGSVGPYAKAIGAASLPFHARFMVEEVGLAAFHTG